MAEGVSIVGQVGTQALAVAVTCAWTAVVTAASLALVNVVSPLRVDAEGETEGLDLVLHDERGYNL